MVHRSVCRIILVLMLCVTTLPWLAQATDGLLLARRGPSVRILPLDPPLSTVRPSDGDPEMSEEKRAVRRQYLRALQARQQGRWEEATTRYEGLLVRYPVLQDYVMRELGRMVLRRLDRHKNDQSAAAELVTLGQHILGQPATILSGWAYYFVGRGKAALGNSLGADLAYARSMADGRGPSEAELHYRRGLSAEEDKRFSDAYGHHSHAAHLGTGDTKIWAQEGMARVRPHVDSAGQEIGWYLTRDKLSHLVSRGRCRQAMVPLRNALQGCDVPEVVLDLRRLEGICMLRLSRHEQGMDALLTLMNEELEAGRPNWSTIERLQKTLGRRGSPATRRALLERFIEGQPDEDGVKAYFIMASILKDQGRIPEAESLYEEVVRRFPQSPHSRKAQWLLAWGRIRRGEHQRAQVALETLVMLTPSGSTEEARARYWLARLTEMTGHSTLSADLFEQVHSLFPDSYYGAMAWWRRTGFPSPVRPTAGGTEVASKIDADTPETAAPALSEPPGVEPAVLGLQLLFPGFEENLALIRSPGPRAHVARAKELWLLGLERDARAELKAASKHAQVDAQTLWMCSALSHAMGSIFLGVRYGHQYLTKAGDQVSLERLALAYPMPYRGSIVRHAGERALEPALVAALIQQESTFNARARSRAGARGLMQIMPYTGREIAGWLKMRGYSSRYLTRADFNLRLGTEYLKAQLTRFDQSLVKTLAAYNAGPHRVTRWQERYGDLEDDYFAEEIPFPETRNYVRRVIRNYYGYLKAYGIRVAVGDPLPGTPLKSPSREGAPRSSG